MLRDAHVVPVKSLHEKDINIIIDVDHRCISGFNSAAFGQVHRSKLYCGVIPRISKLGELVVPLNTVATFGAQIVRNIICKKSDPEVCSGDFPIDKYPTAKKKLLEIAHLLEPYSKSLEFKDQSLKAVFEEFE